MLRSVRARISHAEVKATVAVLIVLAATASTASAASANSFVDATPGTTTFAVPAGVHALSVRLTAGAGGDLTNSAATTLVQGGAGALVTGTVAVSPGEQLRLIVATNGGKANASTVANGAGGAPDGGTGGYSAAGGGGATRVLACQSVTCSLAIIAAGGGGAGASGYVSINSTVSTLAGGQGGAAGTRGGDGASDTTVNGGSGGEPGTSSADGTGGSGLDAGSDGSGPTGGAGGNQSGNVGSGEGGGGGGGGLFGGGGGGSGASGMDASFNPAFTGGGGGGGGSSLPPSGGKVELAPAGATPRIVLTWSPPPVPAVTRLTRSPEGFVAASSGPSGIPANGGPGTRVDYTLNVAASVKFTVLRSRPGRKAKGGRCVKATTANRKAPRCIRLVTVPGTFTRGGGAGTNSFRFTGRLAGRKLKPGKYRLVATPSASGKTGSAASIPFRIVS